jgi:thiol-disulfide isomerase/thioredoxin
MKNIMPSQPTNKLTSALIQRIQTGLVAADTDGDGKVSPSEREGLPTDIRPVADATAHKHFSGGSLPIDTYVEAYTSYVSKAVALVDTNRDGKLSEAEQQNLPGAVYSSVVALRSAINSGSLTGNLDSLYQQYDSAGWTDERLSDFIQQAQSKDQLKAYRGKIKQALLSPKLGENAHTGDRFFEAVAWYTDKTIAGSSDGALTLNELRFAMDQKAKEYLSLAALPERADQRRQTFKNIEKLALLEKQIIGNGDSSYSYDPAKMMQVNSNNAWNASHTIDSAAEFDSKVREASFEKPVLVKYGLTYCMHCLLLEQLDSVHAVADKYGDDLDVYKVWWNPNDPAMAEISDLTVAEGVNSSPYFMVYKDGEVVRKGYGFPDEKGQGLEELLDGIV